MKNLLFSLIVVVSMACQNEKSADNTAANKAIIETYYTHFNKHDWQKMAEMYADSAQMKDPAYGNKAVKMTPAEIQKKYEELNKTIPDVKDSVVSMYHSGDNVIVEFVSTGTSPDNSKFELPICTIFEIKNGKITKDFTYYDNF
ncbi:MAG: nuclear transport factor 2 family protein [Spirosomataceae bacterium]